MKSRKKSISVKVICVVCKHKMEITAENNTGETPMCPKCYSPMATEKVLK